MGVAQGLESTWSQQVAISESLYFMSGLKKHSSAPHEVRTAFLTLRHVVISLDWY